MVGNFRRCFDGGMKEMAKQNDNKQVRAYVDLSALYPSDPIHPHRPLRSRSRKKRDCPGNDGEKEAVREALEGWRWI